MNNLVGRLLLLLVEGDDDERFFKRVIIPIFDCINYDIRIWKYRQEKKEKTEKFLLTASKMGTYLLFQDIDSEPCFVVKRNKVGKNFSTINIKNIIIVISEIESWYLSGIDMENCKKIGICKFPPDTNSCSKEQFYKLIPKEMPKIEFMNNLLNVFDVEIGKKRNTSFGYFIKKAEKLNLLKKT
jgi:hypothetical protein